MNSRSKWWLALFVLILLGGAALGVWRHQQRQTAAEGVAAGAAGAGSTAAGPGGSRGGPGAAPQGAGARGPGGGRNRFPGMDPNRATPVQVAAVGQGSIEITIAALGTVTARNTATVRARVSGLLSRVNFKEGQLVKAGDLLAEIDPRPYQVLLDQALGQLARDEAMLVNAKVDLDRYRRLLKQDSIAQQQVAAQEALVRQYEGTVLSDKGQVDSARLQLSFTKITAPLAGRLGLRQVDVGNMVQPTDTNGLVVITETEPITALFSIPAESLPAVLKRLHAGEVLKVEAFGSDGAAQPIAVGRLLTVDNQIDTTTGTIRLKTEFPNTDRLLFPNQFVNIRLVTEVRPRVALVSTAAVQRGTQGAFVYRVRDGAVQVVVVRTGAIHDGRAEVLEGLAVGDQVVVDGVDHLREGSKVEIVRGGSAASGVGAAAAAAGPATVVAPSVDGSATGATAPPTTAGTAETQTRGHRRRAPGQEGAPAGEEAGGPGTAGTAGGSGAGASGTGQATGAPPAPTAPAAPASSGARP